MTVSNCKQCKVVFKKIHSPYCPACYSAHMEQFSVVYRFLQDKSSSSIISLNEVAEICDVPLSAVEEMFYSGELGTASLRLSFPCQKCGVPIPPIQRRGHFCLRCSEQLRTEGDIQANEESIERDSTQVEKQKRLLQDVRRQEAKEIAQVFMQEAEQLRDAPPKPIDNPESFGFKRNPAR